MSLVIGFFVFAFFVGLFPRGHGDGLLDTLSAGLWTIFHDGGSGDGGARGPAHPFAKSAPFSLSAPSADRPTHQRLACSRNQSMRRRRPTAGAVASWVLTATRNDIRSPTLGWKGRTTLAMVRMTHAGA
jgi:hypothetical protein